MNLFLLMIIAQFTNELRADEFVLRWKHEQQKVQFELSAPTSGWVALGFSTDENIVKTNLIQASVHSGVLKIEDQYVTGLGVHPTIESLGGIDKLSSVSGIEKDGSTTIKFSLPQEKMDQFHFDLQPEAELFVWLAYSVSDDFDHHSRKRILRKIKL